MDLRQSGRHIMNNKLYLGDNLEIMKSMEDESVDLICTDPPFNSGRSYKSNDKIQFNDKWKSMDDFLDFMKPRLIEIHRLLKETGSFYLHCAPSASHYLKVLLDQIFGYKNFRNEIIWCYRGGGVPKNAFARKHDIILFYGKGTRNTFYKQYVPYSEASQNLVNKRNGKTIAGNILNIERGGSMPDWWADINSLQTWSPERLGYPTQKPVKLYQRIIKASSNPGDLVFDPFAGSGTTIDAAQSLDRRWVGVDQNKSAIETIEKRLTDKYGFTAKWEAYYE